MVQAPSGGESLESPRPLQQRDALGGDLFCSIMAALNFQLPHQAMQAVSHPMKYSGQLLGTNWRELLERSSV